MTVEAAHPVIQVIDDKEKKIAFGLRKVCGKTEEKNQNRSQPMHPERPDKTPLSKLQSNLDRIDFLSSCSLIPLIVFMEEPSPTLIEYFPWRTLWTKAFSL